MVKILFDKKENFTLFYSKLYLPKLQVLFHHVKFEKISAKYAKAYSARKYVQFHGLGSQLAVIREEWGILKREEGWCWEGGRVLEPQ